MPNSITVCESFGLEWNSKSTHIPIHMTLKPLGVQMVTWTTHENTVAVRSIISRKNKVNEFISYKRRRQQIWALWWFFTCFSSIYILLDQPITNRNLMVQWAKAPGFKPRHFAVLWFDPQSSNIFFHKINFSLIIFLSFNFEKYFFIVS